MRMRAAVGRIGWRASPNRVHCAPLSTSLGRAGVAKWQTRGTQNPVGATSCRFKSDLRHSFSAVPSRGRLLAYVVGIALGDGNLSNPNGRATRLRVTCDLQYPHLARRITRCLRALLPDNRVGSVRKRSRCIDISCYSNHWEQLLGWRVDRGSKITQGVSITACSRRMARSTSIAATPWPCSPMHASRSFTTSPRP